MSRSILAAALAMALSVAALPVLAAADAVPRDVVGDWKCGDTRLVLTRLGSIEVVDGARYRAGLVRARDGVLEVTWDGGGSARLRLARRGEALRVEGLGAPMGCTLRR